MDPSRSGAVFAKRAESGSTGPAQDGADSEERSSAPGDSIRSTRCGLFGCEPDCLQRCNKPGTLLAVMCLFGLVDSYVQWGLVPVNLSTLERRYGLQSSQSAWIVSSQDLASGVLGPVLGYLGAYLHKGRLMTSGLLVMFVANVLFMVPHFASDVYDFSGAYGTTTCQLETNSSVPSVCDSRDQGDESYWLAVFCVAQVLYGYVSTTLWIVGITYLDENCRFEDTPLYLGILYTMGAVGACLGFLGGGLFLQIFVDIGRVDMDEVTVTPSDPRWVGAWWMGFAVAAGLSLPIAFFMPCFPRELPGTNSLRKHKKSQAHKGGAGSKGAHSSGRRSWADVGVSLRVVFGNPVFILITLAGIFEVGAVTSYAAFLPKVLQFQFGLTTTMSAIVAGAIIVPGAGLGQLLGGIIPKAAKLRLKGIMWMLVICQFTCCLCAFGFLASCATPRIYGYNEDYPLNSSLMYQDPLIHECNAACNCSTLEFAPVCAGAGVAFFSPCHGGCTTEEEIDGSLVYKDCSCLPTNSSGSDPYQGSSGICEESDCSQFWIFMPLFLIIVIATFIESTGGAAATMRVVPEKHRSFAFGVQSPIIKFLGSVPFPIIFGLIFDTACDVWQDDCGTQGACWIYDVRYLAIGIFASCLIVKGLSGVFFLIGLCIYKEPTPYEQFKGDTETSKIDGSPTGSIGHVTGSPGQVTGSPGQVTETEGQVTGSADRPNTVQSPYVNVDIRDQSRGLDDKELADSSDISKTYPQVVVSERL